MEEGAYTGIMSKAGYVLGANRHGKGRVRLLKLHRRGDQHDFIQLTAQILVEGDMDDTFKQADNSRIIATDTVKNTVYVLASRNEFASIEEFAIIIGKHFLAQYPSIVNKCDVKLVRDLWTRVVNKDSHGRVCAHNHAFIKLGPQTTYTHCVTTRVGRSVSIELRSGIKDLQVLKTTQSGFDNFHRDEYRTLPDTQERLVASSVEAEWKFTQGAVASRPDYEALNKQIIDTLIDEFAGPADKGVFSASVQATLWDMGAGTLAKIPQVEKIELYMPNIHNIPFDLSKLKMQNKDHTGHPNVFFPTDEPHGMIQAIVSRPTTSRL